MSTNTTTPKAVGKRFGALVRRATTFSSRASLKSDTSGGRSRAGSISSIGPPVTQTQTNAIEAVAAPPKLENIPSKGSAGSAPISLAEPTPVITATSSSTPEPVSVPTTARSSKVEPFGEPVVPPPKAPDVKVEDTPKVVETTQEPTSAEGVSSPAPAASIPVQNRTPGPSSPPTRPSTPPPPIASRPITPPPPVQPPAEIPTRAVSPKPVQPVRPTSTGTIDSVSFAPSSSPRALSVHTTRQPSYDVELSPIQEDERSAIEAKQPISIFGASVVSEPQASIPVPDPYNAPSTITAPLPQQLQGVQANGTVPQKDFTLGSTDISDPWAGVGNDVSKGKQRDNTTTTLPDYMSSDGYSTKAVPNTVPQLLSDRTNSAEDPFRDPDQRGQKTQKPESYAHLSTPPRAITPPAPFSPHEAARNGFYQSPFSFHQQEQTHNLIQGAGVTMPLPPVGDVTSRNLRNVPSDNTLAGQGHGSSKPPSVHPGTGGHETEWVHLKRMQSDQKQSQLMSHDSETRPLLPRPVPGLDSSAWQAQGNSDSFYSLGWNDHVLPDGRTYYYHPYKRITTDIDLNNGRKLNALTAYLKKKYDSTPPDGWEIWLHDDEVVRDEFLLVKNWVSHVGRSVGFNAPPMLNVEQQRLENTLETEDKLDSEYRYWSYIAMHPAHAPLPSGALSEATDILMRSYSVHMIPKPMTKDRQPGKTPFTGEESKGLLDVLRSLGNSDSSTQHAVQTEIVAGVLLQNAHWKQQQFRPNKPLPRDIASVIQEIDRVKRPKLPQRKNPVTDFVLGWLCLGIPFFFADRYGRERLDEENGLKNVGSLLVLGASVCLISAIILSASVTFLALPGLDNTARTAGFVAILASVASLASSLIALSRHQTEAHRFASRTGNGLLYTVSTRGSVLMSLPAVFLAWAIVAFVTAMVLYAFRGTMATDPDQWTKFAQYTKWTTVGVLGFSAFLLAISMFFVRR